jgi:FKBP-type peptidyl-prolyl cis-trans isomerase
MRKVFIFFAAILIFTSCKKQHDGSCAPATPASEAASMAAFCTTNNINYTVDSNGIYYQIIDRGSGSKAGMNSIITATYSTSLLNGQLVDTTHLTTPVTLPLSQFIEGWRIAIPYILEGGHIKMVIPSSLAYGCTGVQNLVPSNAPLYYDVLLLGVSN